LAGDERDGVEPVGGERASDEPVLQQQHRPQAGHGGRVEPRAAGSSGIAAAVCRARLAGSPKMAAAIARA
jgi:hypothetical protein